MLIAALAVIAAAQDVPVPELNAQLYHPPVSADQTLWTEGTSAFADEGVAAVRGATHFVHRPLGFRDVDGNVTAVVGEVLQLDAIGAFAFDRARVALDVPVYLYSTGQLTDNGAGLGDVALDLGVGILERGEEPLGLALDVRLTMPTTTVAAPLGSTSVGVDALVVADADVGPIRLAGNLGAAIGPESELLNVTWGDSLLYRGGVGYAVSEEFGLSADLAGQSSFAGLSSRAGSALELLGGGWAEVATDVTVRAGIGRGLTGGLGASQARVIAMVSWDPGATVRDRDGDGLDDTADKCPREPEDLDGYADEDGCPDPAAEVLFLVRGDGVPVSDAQLSMGGVALEGDSIELHPGAHRVSASSPGFGTREIHFWVADLSEQTVEVALAPLPKLGIADITVLDRDGRLVPGLTYSVDGRAAPAPPDGRVRLALPPGPQTVLLKAPGYATTHVPVRVASTQTVSDVVAMTASQVNVTDSAIELLASVEFEKGRVQLAASSLALLDEVAAVMLDRQDIVLLRVAALPAVKSGGGAVDVRLATQRAEAVARYISARGVGADRVLNAGYETAPMQITGEGVWRLDVFVE